MPLSADRSLHELVEEIAAPTPAPGAGSTSAWATALAAGLAEMAARLTLSRDDYAEQHPRMHEIHARAVALRGAALELGERELRSYEPVLEALRRPADDPERSDRVAAALAGAADAPLAVAGIAAEVAELAAELARTGNRSLEGDAAAGATLAEAACAAAARLVQINLARHPGDPRLAEATALAARAAAARSEAAAGRP
jgi:formiminotetrahydrofolate cyclodeaminase